jgi:hypothetical protein
VEKTTLNEVFTIRLWREMLDEGKSEWRGKIQHLPSKDSRYFNKISSIEEFISDHLRENRVSPVASLDSSSYRNRSLGLYDESIERERIQKGGILHSIVRWIRTRSFWWKGKGRTFLIRGGTFLLATTFVILLYWTQNIWFRAQAGGLYFRPDSLFFGLVGFPHGIKLTRKKARQWHPFKSSSRKHPARQ